MCDICAARAPVQVKVVAHVLIAMSFLAGED